nr:hypothetical protein [Escherichia coli]
MGNLNETEKWEENIYQLETSDPVLGGADGISNRAPRQLANRTKWLKKKTEEAAQSLAEHVRSRNHPDRRDIKSSPPATGKQDEMAEEENGGSRTVTG